jgi:hypothetical protein
MTEKEMTTLDIIKQYLEANGYDGLAGEECGCFIDDLVPCGFGIPVYCRAGYKTRLGYDGEIVDGVSTFYFAPFWWMEDSK